MESRANANFNRYISNRSVGTMLGRAANRSNLFRRGAIRNDTPTAWRMDWAAHDPATPMMELQANTHSTTWATMIFVCVSVVYLMRKC